MMYEYYDNISEDYDEIVCFKQIKIVCPNLVRFEEKRGLEPGPRRWEYHLPREILEPSRG